MTSHAIALLLRVTAKQYADASRQSRDGNLNANPLVLSFIEQRAYGLTNYTAECITLMDIATG